MTLRWFFMAIGYRTGGFHARPEGCWINLSSHDVQLGKKNWPKFCTQGYCSLIDSVTMNETRVEEKFSPGICFSSDQKLLLFVLFPGQKVFISIYHPFQALPSVELRKYYFWYSERKKIIFIYSGLAFFNAVVKMRVTKRLKGADNCTVSQNDFDSLLAVHRDFEKW